MPMVLFVCTGNRFRSPIAAACFEQELQLHGMAKNWSTGSAGTWTTDGLPPMSEAVAAARRLGLDIAAHRSRIVNVEMLDAADLILVMERGHKEALSIEFPRCCAKIKLLTEVTGGQPYDIPDPVSEGLTADICGEILDIVHTAFGQICALIERTHNEKA